MRIMTRNARCLSYMVSVTILSASPAWAGHSPARTQAVRAEAARTAETIRNRAIITAFADIFYRQGDIERAMMTYVVPDYIQHSPGVPNGRAAMLEMARRFAGKPKPSFEIKRIVVDGDIAILHVRGQLKPDVPAEAVFDMYRLKDGKIVEHWDVKQSVPPAAASTMF